MDHFQPKFEAWREAQGLTYERLGSLLGCSGVTARRIALGIRQPDAVTADRIVSVTGGEVSVLDLHAARLAYERASTPEISEGGGEAGGGEGASGHGPNVAADTAAVTANDAGGFA